MLANFVKETASAPGTSTTFNLGGATAPFVTFASSFANGATCLYVMYSTTQAEWGVATVTHGSPNTLSRTTVVGNTAGTTAKLNFTGTTTVICAPIAGKAVYLNASDNMTLGGAASSARLSVKHDGTTAPIGTEVAGTSSLLAVAFQNGNGVVGTITTSGTATAYNTSSDYRLKITYGPADASVIGRLRVHDAAFRSDGARYPMFLAHEMQDDGAGFAVRGEKDGPEMQQVDHSKLVPALVAYAQQLRADLDRALARLNAIGA
jgi:hypothetical protein